MKEISDAGICTWAFIGPILPGLFSENDIELLLRKIKDAGASRVLYDRLRMKPGIKTGMLSCLSLRPDLKTAFDATLGDLSKGDSTARKIKARAIELGMTCDPAF